MSLKQQELEELKNLQCSFNHDVIFHRAGKRGRVREVSDDYNGGKYLYALLSVDLANPDELYLKRYLELMEKRKVTGFCMARSYDDGNAFVMEKNVPLEFQPPVALHEIAEARSLPSIYEFIKEKEMLGIEFPTSYDPKIEAHKEACGTDLPNVFLKGKEFSLRYIKWLPNDYFTNADTHFFEGRDRNKMNTLELILQLIDVVEFFGRDFYTKKFSWLEDHT